MHARLIARLQISLNGANQRWTCKRGFRRIREVYVELRNIQVGRVGNVHEERGQPASNRRAAGEGTAATSGGGPADGDR